MEEEIVKKPVSSLKKVSQERRDKVIELHDAGHSQNYISTVLSMTCRTAQAILEASGRKRTRSEQSYFHHKTSTLKEDAFDVIDTEEKAYWLGFIYADGFITNPNAKSSKKYNVGILLKKDDIGHLEKFKQFLDAPQKITLGTSTIKGIDKTYYNARINIGSQKLHKKLQNWGITWNKSYDAKPPEEMKTNRDFWRGVVDGDGYLGIVNDKSRAKGRKRLHLCGTIDMVQGFKDFLVSNGIGTTYEVVSVRESMQYKMEVSSTMAEKAVKLLYEGSTVYLERKYQRYLEIIKENSNFETQKEPYAS